MSIWVDLPVERLRFEYEKRQQKMKMLYMEMNRLSRELEEDYEEDRLDRIRDPSFYRGEGSETIFVNEGKIQRLEQEAHELEGEMKAIEKVLDVKWR